MVEMSETSAILHNATARSLVLLDEIGRGTSTYDGVAIAWAVTEHLHDRVGCKTMFATHYHELMQLPERLQHARNYNVAVRESGRDGGLPAPARARAAPTAPTASTWPSSPGLPGGWCARARARYWARWKASIEWCPGPPPPLARSRAARRSSPMPPRPIPMVEELRTLDVEHAHPAGGAERLADFKRRRGGPRHEPVARSLCRELPSALALGLRLHATG